MKTKMLALAAITSLGLSAQAQLFNWTLTTSGSPAPGDGSGQLTLSGGVVTSMSGTVGGRTITLLPAGTVVFGSASNDNLLPLDGNGLGIAIPDFGNTLLMYRPSFFSIVGTDTGWIRPSPLDFHQATFTYTPVPEPQEYAMIAGASLVGLALWRRRAQRGVQG